MTTTDVQQASPLQNAALIEAVRRLVELFHPERIYLFGSRARGDCHEDSDWDLLVIVPASEEPGYRLAQSGYRQLRDISLRMELLFATHEEFERQARVIASLPATVLREGQLLYAA